MIVCKHAGTMGPQACMECSRWFWQGTELYAPVPPGREVLRFGIPEKGEEYLCLDGSVALENNHPTRDYRNIFIILKPLPRFAIVFDGKAWFIRGIRTIAEHRDEMVYYCDQHLGGPFATLAQAVACVEPRRAASVGGNA